MLPPGGKTTAIAEASCAISSSIVPAAKGMIGVPLMRVCSGFTPDRKNDAKKSQRDKTFSSPDDE
jgi:hypothetical protein